MKRSSILLICLAAGLLLSSCGVSGQAGREQRRAQKEQERQAMVRALDKADFTLEITQIIPLGYPSRTSTGEYTLRIRDNVVNTRLPYIGDSHMATFGSDEISIVFKNEKVTLLTDFSNAASKGEYLYRFTGGEGPDPWTVNLQVYDNGKAVISCSSRSGRTMNYYAEMRLPDSTTDE